MHLLTTLQRCYILLLAISLPACTSGQTQIVRPTPSPLPQEELLQVYTNHEPASSYTEPYRKQTRAGDDLEQIIVEAIASAHSTIDVAVQELRLPKIANALIERQKAGVKVRVILENTYSRPYSSLTPEDVAKLEEREQNRYKESLRLIDQDGDGKLSQSEIEQRDALVMLDLAQIPRIDDTADGSAGSNLMHHKFLVVDGHTLIITSANFTPSDTHGDFQPASSRGNANSLLKIASPELAALFTQEFNLMWGDGPGGKPNSRFGTKKPYRSAQQVTVGSTLVEVQFSPTAKSVPWERSSNGLIGKTLSGANQSIQMALFVLSDQKLVNLLEPTHQKGVEIQALIDPGFAYRSYSEALDMMGITLADKCRYEPNNRPWQTPITSVGVPRMPPGDLLHHKFGIVDGKIVIVGSHNWTDAANAGNDETLLVIHSPTVTAHFQREFERLYTDAILGVPPAIRKKAAAQAKECPPPNTLKATGSNDSAPKNEGEQSQKPSSVSTHPDRINRTKQPGNRGSSRVTSAAQQSNGTQQSQQQPVGQLVNLNTATQEELEALPGVGPSLAKRIITARQQKPFTSLEDLDRVPGVGPKLLKKLQTQVTW